MNKIINWILTLIGIAAAVFSAVMLAMAIRFGEMGRVLFYLLILIVAVEVAVVFGLKLRSKKNGA